MGLFGWLFGDQGDDDDHPATEAQLAAAARRGLPGRDPESYREFGRNAYADGRSVEDVESCHYMWEAD